jgi:hypothetical protein
MCVTCLTMLGKRVRLGWVGAYCVGRSLARTHQSIHGGLLAWASSLGMKCLNVTALVYNGVRAEYLVVLYSILSQHSSSIWEQLR